MVPLWPFHRNTNQSDALPAGGFFLHAGISIITEDNINMGSSASTITKDQSVALTQTLRTKYEEYKAHGMDEAEVQAKLTKEYFTIIESLKNPAASPRGVNKAENAKLGNAGKSKTMATATETSSSTSKLLRASFEGKSNSIGTGASSKLTGGVGLSSKMAANNLSSKLQRGGSRRRSFDGSKAAPAAAAIVAAQEALKKAEEAADAAAAATPVVEEVQADSWDSISQQPFCAVCQMAFKSAQFLERHVKYSDLHLKNVKKAEAASQPTEGGGPANPITPADNDMLFEVSPSGKVMPKQVEGKHYRLIYSGSKLFWRTQETVDLNIFHHILPSTIEVVSYDTMKAKEMNRLYLDYTSLCDQSGVTAAAQASAGARAAAARAQAAREMEATSAVGTTARAAHQAATMAAEAASALAQDPANVVDETAMIARYIIQRLQLGNLMGPNSNLKKMEFVKLSSDTYTKSPVMDKVPVVLIPIAVARRRRTNAEEIEATISSLNMDRAALAEATSHAHKVASVVYSSATSIASKKWWADFNPVRRKWIWAIRRVIRQKLVAETTAVLAKLEAGKKSPTKGTSVKGQAKEV